jgi:hypothetical protein
MQRGHVEWRTQKEVWQRERKGGTVRDAIWRIEEFGSLAGVRRANGIQKKNVEEELIKARLFGGGVACCSLPFLSRRQPQIPTGRPQFPRGGEEERRENRKMRDVVSGTREMRGK